MLYEHFYSTKYVGGLSVKYVKTFKKSCFHSLIVHFVMMNGGLIISETAQLINCSIPNTSSWNIFEEENINDSEVIEKAAKL